MNDFFTCLFIILILFIIPMNLDYMIFFFYCLFIQEYSCILLRILTLLILWKMIFLVNFYPNSIMFIVHYFGTIWFKEYLFKVYANFVVNLFLNFDHFVSVMFFMLKIILYLF